MPGSEDQEDVDLLEKAAGGSRDSFAALYAKHRRRLWAFLVRLEENADVVDELIQETFVRALRSAKGFAGKGKVSTWLFSIALNAHRSRLRKRQRFRLFRQRSRPSGTADDPASMAEQADTADRVRQAIGALPENQKSALVLSRYEGLSYEEIAEIESCSVDAVKQRVRRALMRLRKELRELQ
ncbi:MAG TPA: RNA polymerase sigma factor [Candidatus Hydrogenedentes bacterium]|nr:RNA polymerase sigma factor [Candidatus Hydrogenedentota bacterium]